MRMTARIGATLALAALAGCSSELPFNPFGPSRAERIDAARLAADRPVVDQVVSLEVAPTRSGAIVSVVGLPPTQGYWEADLIRVPSGDPSVLLLDFALLPPPMAQPVGTRPSREVLGGAALTNRDLAGIRTIVVRGARNSRSVRRD